MPAIKFATHTQSLVPIKPPPMPQPWSAEDNVYLYWSGDVDKRITGENVRHALKLGRIEGGEYRDSNFIYDLEGQLFRDLTLTCCSVLVFPPLDNGFPLFEPNGRIEHRISRYVANGNTMIFTGDLTATMFINTIFKFGLEPVDSNYSPGPFIKYEPKKLPAPIQKLGDSLFQDGVQVTNIHKFSLPVGTTVFFASPNGSPFFSIQYCERMARKAGNPPEKVSPAHCKALKAKGVSCGCGNIIYVGYDFADGDNEKWNAALRASLTLVIGKDEGKL